MNIRKIDTGLYVEQKRYEIDRVIPFEGAESQWFVRDNEDTMFILGPLTLDEAIKWAAEHNQEEG